MASRTYRSWGTAGYSNYAPGYTSTYTSSYMPDYSSYRSPEYYEYSSNRPYNPYTSYRSYYSSNRSLEDSGNRPAFYGSRPYGYKFDFVNGRYSNDNRFTNLKDAEEPLYYQDITDLYLNTSKLQSDYRDILDRYSHLRRNRAQGSGLPDGYGPVKYSAPGRVSAAERYGLYDRRPRYGNRKYDTEVTEYEPYTPSPNSYERAKRQDHQGSVGNVLYSKEMYKGQYNVHEDGPRTREEWELLEREHRNHLAHRYPHERDGVRHELEREFDQYGYDKDGYDREGYHRDQNREGAPGSGDPQERGTSDLSRSGYEREGYKPREYGSNRDDYGTRDHGTPTRDRDTASPSNKPSTDLDGSKSRDLDGVVGKKPGDEAYLETGDNERPKEEATPEEDMFPEEEEEPAPAPVVKSGRSLLIKQGSFMNVKKEEDVVVEEAIPLAGASADVESAVVESAAGPVVEAGAGPVVEAGIAPSVEAGAASAVKAGPVAALKAQAGGLKKSSSRSDVERISKIDKAKSAVQEGGDSDDDLEAELSGKVDSGIDSNEEESYALMEEEELLDDIEEEIDIRIEEPEPEITVYNEISAEDFAQAQEKLKVEEEKEKPLCDFPLIATVTSQVVKVDKIVGEFKSPDPADPDSPVPLSPLPGMASCYVVSPSPSHAMLGATTKVEGVASLSTTDPLSSQQSKEMVLQLEAERQETPLGVTAEVVRLEETTIITETEEEVVTEIPAENTVPAEVHLTLDPELPAEYNDIVAEPVPASTTTTAVPAAVETCGEVTMTTAPVDDKPEAKQVSPAAVKVDSAAAEIIGKSNGLVKEEESNKSEKTEKKSKLPEKKTSVSAIPKPSGKSASSAPEKKSPEAAKGPEKKGKLGSKFGSKLGEQKSKVPTGAPKKKRLW